jgi:hypothetical protein
VNGGIVLGDVNGDIRGETVNGGLRVELANEKWDGPGLDLKTVNGGVTLAVPTGILRRARRAHLNGGISVDFPITGHRAGQQPVARSAARSDLVARGSGSPLSMAALQSRGDSQVKGQRSRSNVLGHVNSLDVGP